MFLFIGVSKVYRRDERNLSSRRKWRGHIPKFGLMAVFMKIPFPDSDFKN